MRVAIDTGGTFTDCVYLADGELQVLKVFSTPADPSQAVLDGLSADRRRRSDRCAPRHHRGNQHHAGADRRARRVCDHGGLRGHHCHRTPDAQQLYDWFAPVPVCLVPARAALRRAGARERRGRNPSRADRRRTGSPGRSRCARSGAEAVAISLLFSFANPETERRVEAALRCLGVPISASHRILPEFREYERASTTVVNAYLAPAHAKLSARIWSSASTAQHAGGRVDVMQSSGGIISARLRSAGAGAHGAVGPGGRRDRRLPGGALGGLRAHHRLRHGRHFDRRLSVPMPQRAARS